MDRKTPPPGSPASQELSTDETATADGADEGFATNRREFLKLGTAGASAIGLAAAGCDPDAEGSGEGLTLKPEFEVTVLRPDDLVALRFGFVNLDLDEASATLVRKNANQSSYLIVTHNPQHVIERAFIETESGAPPVDLPTPPPIDSRIAGESRIVYLVPSGVTQIPFTTAGLLDACARFEMVVGLNALPPDPPIKIFFPRPILHVALGANVSSISIVKPPVFVGSVVGGGTRGNLLDKAGLDVGSSAIVMCTEDGRPPQVAATNIALAARNTRAYAYLSKSAQLDLLPDITLPPIQLQPKEPKAPQSGETALEIPFRLLISPNKYGQWAHALGPVVSKEVTPGRVELWHTRLGVQGEKQADGSYGPADESSSFYRTIRALWSRDPWFAPLDPYKAYPTDDPFRASLTPENRGDIVHQTSNFKSGALSAGFRPKPVQVNRLMLTALGGWIDARGDWGDSPPLGLSLWEHRGTMGRDHFVRIVETGVLYPFGHRAVVVTISERKFKREVNDSHPHVAYVRKRSFIIVKQPVMQYENGRSASPSTEKVLRQNPFTAIHIKTLVTPTLDNDSALPDFLPTVGGQPFRFQAEAIDIGGNVVKFTTPVYFVKTVVPMGGTQPAPQDAGSLGRAKTNFDDPGVGLSNLGGQRMAFAPFDDASGAVDDTVFETKTLLFKGGNIPAGAAGYIFSFLPTVAEAKLAVEAVRQLAGANAAPTFKFAKEYVDHGFGGANAGDLLFTVKSAAEAAGVDFKEKSDKSGGLVAPSLKVTALSRKTGPISGDPTKFGDSINGGKIDPKDFFGEIEALLFGVFNLFDILPVQDLLKGAPKFVTEALDAVETFIADAKKLKKQLEGLSAAADTLADEVEDVVDQIANLGAGFDETQFQQDLLDVGVALENVANAVPTVGFPDGERRAIIALAKKIRAIIEDAAKFLDLVKAFRQGIELAKNLRVRLEWRPRLQNFPADKPIFQPDNVDKALLLALELRGKDLPGKPAGFDLVCSLDNFKLNLIAPLSTVIILDFDKVQFRVESGKKPEIDVIFGGITFDGCLSFIEELKKLIPFDGFSDPPAVDVSAEGIKAQFSIPIPSVTIGVFSLTNLSFGAGFEIPFIGKPLTVNFNFCTREQPFMLTVMMLGGGGYVGLTLYPKGLYLLEVALEFGAALSVDFGVASGSVSIVAGIYLKVEGDAVTLTGYLRIRGEVDVLGLISASIEMRMELTYESSSGKTIGRATIEIEVEIFFLSFSVSVTAERKFAGSAADPTFEDVLGPEPLVLEGPNADPWPEYLNAFAA